MISPEYIAGFFDGEGCVYAAPDSAYIQIELAQKDRRPLDGIAEMYGGSVRKCTGIHKWMCPTGKVVVFLSDILPFLIVKKRQAELALEFRKLVMIGGNGRGRWKDAAELAKPERLRISNEICEAKRCSL